MLVLFWPSFFLIDSFCWYWIGSLHKNIQLMLGFLKGPLLVLQFSYYNDIPDYVICNIAICADDATLYSKCEQASDLWQQLELASKLESNPQVNLDWGKKWLVDFNAGKITLTLITLVLLISKWMGLFLRKNHLLRCWGRLSLPSWIGALPLSLLHKLLPRKLEF